MIITIAQIIQTISFATRKLIPVECRSPGVLIVFQEEQISLPTSGIESAKAPLTSTLPDCSLIAICANIDGIACLQIQTVRRLDNFSAVNLNSEQMFRCR
jgi:hypothetical protein